MKKLLATLLLALFSLNGFAGSLYFGSSLYLQATTSQEDNFRATFLQFAAGYWDAFDCFYLAGEVFIVPFTLGISETNTFRPESASTTYQYGLSLLPGLLLTESVVAYLRAGYVATRFWGLDATKSGGQFGVGLQSDITHNWSLRGEYTFTAYSGVSAIGSPRTDQFGIGFIYKLQ